jgi:cytoskeleton protein RodZ
MMDTTDEDAANAEKTISPKQSVLDVGMTLRKAREGMGLSVHDIANRIKFAPRQVEALEANDFESLPQTTFLRGFVRSYARVLQLDEMALIAALPCDPVSQVAAKTPAVDVAFPTLLSLQRVNLLWLAGTLGVALLLGLFVMFQNDENLAQSAEVVVESVSLPASDAVVSDVLDNEVQTAAKEELTKSPEIQTKAPEEQTKAPEATTKIAEVQPKVPEAKAKTPEVLAKNPEAQAKPPTEEQAKKAEEKKTTAPNIADNLVKLFQSVVSTESQVAPASAPVADAAVTTNTKTELPLEVLKRRPMHFVFDEASWAEVIDVHGNLLLSRNVPRGGEKWIGGPGRAPYAVSIKNPAKVRLYYKGKQIDLSAYAATEMAHLTVK